MDMPLPDVTQTISANPEGRLRAMARGKEQNMQAIEKKAQEFESVYLAEMIRPVMQQIKMPKPYGGGHAEEMFQSLLVDEYAKAMSNAGGVGVATHIKKQLIQLQEKQSWQQPQ